MIEWWHRRGEARIQIGTLSPGATHGVCVPSMGVVLKGFKSPVGETMKARSTSRSQGCQGDRAPEGRLCENHEPMNKNPIEGRSGAVSWHTTAKPFVSAREENGAVVWWRTALLPGEWERIGHGGPDRFKSCPQTCRERSGQESAEVLPALRSVNGVPANRKQPTTSVVGFWKFAGIRVPQGRQNGGDSPRPIVRQGLGILADHQTHH
jgi:hypothetical protein